MPYAHEHLQKPEKGYMYEYFQLFSEITVEISGFFQVKSFLR